MTFIKSKAGHFLLMAFLFVLPFLVVSFAFLNEESEEIEFVKKEIVGLDYHAALFNLETSFQTFRGENYIAGNDPSSKMPEQVPYNMKTAIEAVEALLSTSSENGFSIYEKWTEFRRQLGSALSDHTNFSPEERFNRDTIIINNIQEIMVDVANQSNLILDPDLTSYYMMSLIVNIIPKGTEYVAHSRGLLSSLIAKGSFALEEASPLLIDKGKQEDFKLEYVYALEILAKAQPEGEWDRKLQDNLLLSQLESFQLLVEKEIAAKARNDQEHHNHISNYRNIFHEGTKTIALFKDEYNKAESLLRTNLSTRLKKDIIEWWIALAGICLGLIAAIWTFFYSQQSMLQRKTLESANRLRLSEERFNLAVAGTNDGIWDWPDITKDEEYWSPQFKELLGYKEDEIKGSYKTFLTMLHPGDIDRITAHVQDHFKNNVPFNIEYRLKHKSGEYVWFRAKATTVRNENGDPIRMVGSIRDISQRKKTEQDIQRVLQHKEASAKILEYLNLSHKSMQEMLDGFINILLSISWLNIEEKSRVFIADHHEQIFESEQEQGDYNIPILHNDEVLGMIVLYLKKGHERNEDEVAFLEGVAEILSMTLRRKKMEDEINSSHQKMQMILDMAGDAIITIDENGLIQSYNDMAEKTFGYTAKEAIGNNITMLMPDGDHKEHHNDYLRLSNNPGVISVISSPRELQGKSKDGRIFPIELAVTEVRTDEERIFVGVTRDISERKKWQDEMEERTAELEEQGAALAEAKTQAEEATRMKSEFLANMSHEIRTPMNGVIGMTNLLLETDLDPTQKTYARTAVSSAENLLQLVNDILDFSKIEAGKMEFEIIPFDLQGLIEEVADLIAIKAQEKDLEMLLRFAPDIPRYVMGDPGRVRQVLLNLASNALKFTEAGHILIGIDAIGEKDGKMEFRAYVEDTGIGIAEDKQEHVFGKFSQADESTTRKFGGTGLGLTICRELAHMMDGDVGLTSTLGLGSKFWFSFCLAIDESAKERKTIDPSVDLSGIHAIIVDDNKVAQDIAIEHMRKAGMKVVVASSGKEALEVMRKQVDKGVPFEIGVLDYMMPGMDGVELAKAIKADKNLNKTALLMISSAPSRGDGKRMQETGFYGYLTKPCSGNDIIRALAAVRSMQLGKVPFTLITRHSLRDADYREKTDAEEANFDGAQIMLAEDNPTNQMVATTMLTKMGCHVTPAGNGQEAVKLAKQRNFDLIFMDCNMPEMDGFEATKIIRELEKREGFPKTPIVAFTAYAMKGDDQKCFAAGMDDYITKPVKRGAMVDVLKKWLKKDDEVNHNGLENALNINEPSQLNTDNIDMKTLNDMKELMEEKFGPMIEKYLENSARYIAQAEEALANSNAKTLADSAHPLKSLSASVGAMRVSELAAELEHRAENMEGNEKADFSALSIILEDLKTSFLQSKPILKQAASMKN